MQICYCYLHVEVARAAGSISLLALLAASSGAAALRTGSWCALTSPALQAAADHGAPGKVTACYWGSCKVCRHCDWDGYQSSVSRTVLQSPPDLGLQKRVCLCHALPLSLRLGWRWQAVTSDVCPLVPAAWPPVNVPLRHDHRELLHTSITQALTWPFHPPPRATLHIDQERWLHGTCCSGTEIEAEQP